MASDSPSKLQKTTPSETKAEEIDRISSLPDELLYHTLSFLQTKEVVATSVLSTKWKSVWTLVPALDFEDKWSCFSKTTSFANIVGKITNQHKTKTIKRFCFSSNNNHCTPEFVSTMVSLAVEKNIEELDIFFYFGVEASLPSMLFTCRTISVLKLDGTISLSTTPSYVHFPSLKILHLFAHNFADHEPITRLLSGCLVLEELCYFDAKIDRICVPSLKNLYIESNLERLYIDTPLLEHLQLQDTTVIDYSVETLPNLINACIGIYFDPYEMENMPSIFHGIQKVKYLYLANNTTEVLTYYAGLEFPEFHNLVHLQLSLIIIDSYFLVEKLLPKCPRLEFLDIEKAHESRCDEEWTEPRSVPSCLSSHLTVLKFRHYGGTEKELELLGYILKNAKVLKKIIIHIVNWLKPTEMDCAIEELLLLPKASEDCKTHYEILD